MRTNTTWVLLILSVVLAGCGDGLAGTYADKAGITCYTFSGSGDVKISVLGTEVDAEYRVDDDKVLVTSAQGTVVLTRRDKRLYGPMGLELIHRQTNTGE